MKKLFLTMLIALVGISAMAQDKKFGVGFDLLYGTKIKNIGFGVKGQYYATEAIRVEADAVFYPKKDDVRLFDACLVGHYLIPVAENMKVYPIVGAGLINWVDSIDDYTDSSFTVHLGGGYQFDIAEDFALSAEAKYEIVKDHGQVVFALGAVYKF